MAQLSDVRGELVKKSLELLMKDSELQHRKSAAVASVGVREDVSAG